MGVGDVVCQTLQKHSQKPKILATETSGSLSSQSELKRGPQFPRDYAQPQTKLDPPPSSNQIEHLWHSVVQDLDFQRTLRFALVGLTLHGPYFLHGFRWLDATFGPSKSLQIAVAKTALGQVSSCLLDQLQFSSTREGVTDLEACFGFSAVLGFTAVACLLAAFHLVVGKAGKVTEICIARGYHYGSGSLGAILCTCLQWATSSLMAAFS